MRVLGRRGSTFNRGRELRACGGERRGDGLQWSCEGSIRRARRLGDRVRCSILSDGLVFDRYDARGGGLVYEDSGQAESRTEEEEHLVCTLTLALDS